MTQNLVSSHSSPRVYRRAARIAVILSAAFLFILFLLHFLEPEFDPSWRMISEYELGRYGWMMAVAFFCWGGSVFALLVALWPSLRTLSGKIGRWWLIVILTFPISASLVAGSLARNQGWAGERRWLLWTTLLAWSGLIVYFGSIIVSNAINPGAGRVGPQVFQGWPNRFMVVVYNIWLIIIALRAGRLLR